MLAKYSDPTTMRKEFAAFDNSVILTEGPSHHHLKALPTYVEVPRVQIVYRHINTAKYCSYITHEPLRNIIAVFH